MNELKQAPTPAPQGGVSTRTGVASAERPAFGLPGVPVFLVWLLAALGGGALLLSGQVALASLLGLILLFVLIGFFKIGRAHV